MPDGIYAAAAGMAAQQTRIDLLANDVANLNTTGYKSQRIAFRDLVYGSEGGVQVGAGTAAIGLGATQTSGALQPTGRTLDIALDGPGFIQVRRSDGSTALTRDGHLDVDGSGDLVTSSGEKIDPPVRVPGGTKPEEITISPDGEVTVAGKSAGKLTLVDVPSPAGLLAIGDNLFATTAASGRPTPSDVKVEQGALEGSNVDLAQTMTDMIDAQRGYELASRAIKTQDELLDMANQIVR